VPSAPSIQDEGPDSIRSTERRAPIPSDDPALTAFAQLVAFRLNARRALISFFDRRYCYILAESTRAMSMQTGEPHSEADSMYWGTTVFPKEQSICNTTLNLPLNHTPLFLNESDELPILVVNDLSKDDRFKDNSCVCGPPHSRFYAGVPITSPRGHRIGSLCALDERPRDGITSLELSFMKDTANTIMRHLEMTRATEDHRLGGLMVKSLGSFAEGKSSLEEWYHDKWDDALAPGPSPENISVPRQRRPTTSGAGPQRVIVQEQHIVDRKESLESSSTSMKSPTPVVTKSASSTKDEDRLSPEMKGTFTRAARMILEATEVEGVVFFDAKVSSFGGLVDDEIPLEHQVDLLDQDKPAAILGYAVSKGKENVSNPQYSMSESLLRHLLRAYSHGQIFILDDDASPTAHISAEGLSSGPSTPFTETVPSNVSRRSESSRSQDDENYLREVFPFARTLVLYPMWDTHRDRWFAGAIIWSSDPMRVFTSEQELCYLAAFCNSVMAEVARLDTKLADAAKGDFISSISHELRSPLHAIQGSCELLMETSIDAFQQSMAQTIQSCSKTLLDTINHVLDFAKINSLTRGSSILKKKRAQSAKHVIRPGQGHANDIMTLIEDVDLSVLTEEVLETVFAGYNFQKSTTPTFNKASTAPDVSLAVIVDINKSDNYVFRTQPGAWRRVLMNIFGNALKYTPSGYVKVKLQVTPSTDEVAEVRLIISDSGIGMSEHYVNNRLFHSFAQEDPLSQGTGLGLSIVKQIVASLGGDIEVRSEKGHGTKFTVYCPLKRSIMSPGQTDKTLISAVKRTRGKNVRFIGFDEEEGDYFPMKNIKSKNATLLILKALDNIFSDWFGMKAQDQGSEVPPDLFVTTESGAQWLRERYSRNASSISSAPVIVVCPGAASTKSTTAITIPGQIFECIAQPCGPHKLAKALTSCLDRHANQLMAKSSDAELSLSDVRSLTLQENVPVSAYPSQQGPITPVEPQRPPIITSLSAPEFPSSRSGSPNKQEAVDQRVLNSLLADDNAINLRLINTQMTQLGHTNTLATNGLEALKAYKAMNYCGSTNRLDVVLIDINMPEMDGMECTRRIRAYEREEGLPPVTVIAVTGLADRESQEEAHSSGINLFLSKPILKSQLKIVLRGVVTGGERTKSNSNG
ncbi:hypothetical protein CC78DRAFT_467373, partial [Lojkania enalia]